MAIIIGDLFMDICTRVQRLPQWDTDTGSEPISILPGGSAANTARQLHALESRCALITLAGTDLLGDAFFRQMESEGMSTSWIEAIPNCTTSTCIVITGPQDRAFISDYSSTDRIDDKVIERTLLTASPLLKKQNNIITYT